MAVLSFHPFAVVVYAGDFIHHDWLNSYHADFFTHLYEGNFNTGQQKIYGRSFTIFRNWAPSFFTCRFLELVSCEMGHNLASFHHVLFSLCIWLGLISCTTIWFSYIKRFYFGWGRWFRVDFIEILLLLHFTELHRNTLEFILLPSVW